MSFVPLGRAILCVNCEAIYAAERGRCPSCSSEHGRLLEKWVGTVRRPEGVKVSRVAGWLLAAVVTVSALFGADVEVMSDGSLAVINDTATAYTTKVPACTSGEFSIFDGTEYGCSGSATTDYLFSRDTDGTMSYVVQNASDAGDTTGAVSLSLKLEGTDGVGTDAARVWAGKEQAWTATASTRDGFMAFYTTLDDTPTERMRIEASGEVGIGTASPGYELHVATGAGDSAVASRLTCVDANCQAIQSYENDARVWGAGVNGSDGFQIRDNTGSANVAIFEAGAPAQSLYVTSSGQVGIGTSSPASTANLEVVNFGSSTQIWGESDTNFQVRGYVHGGTEGSPTATTTNDSVFFGLSGHNGTSGIHRGGDISFVAGSTWTGSSYETLGRIFLTQASSTTPTLTFEFVREGGGGTMFIDPQDTAPSTCSIGDLYVDASGAYCACTSANTWSNMTGTGTCA